MAHLEILAHGTPEQHENFIKSVNNWHYEHSGPVRDGDMAPFVSEVKIYDVRIPEEHVEMFLRDLNVNTFETGKGLSGVKKQGVPFLYKVIKTLRFFTPLKGAKRAEGPPKYGLKGWFNVVLIGKLDDSIQTTSEGKKREVL